MRVLWTVQLCCLIEPTHNEGVPPANSIEAQKKRLLCSCAAIQLTYAESISSKNQKNRNTEPACLRYCALCARLFVWRSRAKKENHGGKINFPAGRRGR